MAALNTEVAGSEVVLAGDTWRSTCPNQCRTLASYANAYFPSRNLLRPVQVNTPAAFDIAFEELGLKDIPCLSERSYGTNG